MTTPSKPTIFISYSRKDKDWKDRLVSHLGVLQEEGLLTLWEDRQIGAGEDWFQEIQAAMNNAKVAILMVSANFLTSKFILSEEVVRLLQRRDEEDLYIYPVIVKPCAWQKVEWLNRMQVRPTGGKALTAHYGHQRDEALAKIATEVLEQFERSRHAPANQKPGALSPKRISTTRLPITGPDLFGRGRELKMLDDAWGNKKTNILSLVAWGGVGKSALVNHWLGQMALNNYRGAERVYGWSFYSQGTTDRAVSADQFIEAALTWFGDKDPNKGSPWDKGERLAQLVAAQRTLLVLDGLEPLQYPPGRDEGRLKDQALQALLRQLAAYNEGLCVISTRVKVTDLSPFEESTVTRIDLDTLSPEAGAQVLIAQGVKGNQAELEQASEEFGGHSLALTLLGSYLSDIYSGDISRRGEVHGLEDDERLGRHAQRVMASYERWFGYGPELAVLRVLGLFNRPADRDSIAALRAAPAIPGLTDTLQGLTEPEWQRVLAKLRRAKFLSAPSSNQPGTLDTHPLVREHFGEQLKQRNPDAWREGNGRLYEHLRDTTKKFPNTIEEMTPLYAAVAHGCAAGMYQEALDEVYYMRIRRGDEAFSFRRLGAFGADLAALVGFFDPPWQQPVSTLRDIPKAFILSEAGSALRALARLVEATQPMQAGLEAYLLHEVWEGAAIVAGNLSALYLTIGDLSQALVYAKKNIELADRSGDSFQSIAGRATLAEALFKLGRLSESEETICKAEEIQKQWQPKLPLLYSQSGFRYCAILLHQGKYQEVQARALQTLEWAMRYNLSPMTVALDHLSLGQSFLLQVQDKAISNFLQATDFLHLAVDGLRQAGHLELLSLGLLVRAELHRIKGEVELAQVDLDEAMSIATRGSMGLYQADCHLEYARLYLAQGDKEKAREHLLPAKEMIERMGYHLRDEDVREIEESLKEAE